MAWQPQVSFPESTDEDFTPPSQQVTESNSYDDDGPFPLKDNNSRGRGTNRMASAVTSSFQPFESVSLEDSSWRTTEVDSCHQQYQRNKEQRTKNMNYIKVLLPGIVGIAAIAVTAFHKIKKSATGIESSLANDQKSFTEVAIKCNASDLADGVNKTFAEHKEEVTVLKIAVKDGVVTDTVDNTVVFEYIMNKKEAALGHGLSELKKRVD